MVESGVMQAVVIVVGLTVLVMVCILFQGRPRPDAYSPEELGQMRIDREKAKEVRAGCVTPLQHLQSCLYNGSRSEKNCNWPRVELLRLTHKVQLGGKTFQECVK